MATVRDVSSKLDSIDIALIEALQANARTPIAELGRKVGLSQPAASERVRRLEDIGVIVGYGVRLDPAALGLATEVSMRVRTSFDRFRPCVEHLKGVPEVVQLRRLTGEECLDLTVRLPDTVALEAVIDDIGRFGDVRTAVVLHAEPPKPLGRTLIRGCGARRA
ncbi:Lrp/AsnC family transcriptional regulator [Sphingomonas corticis]|uniref:Lrp/AsnC family transcriptional regulator n=1 Tax=Sphingomonas corticis TaxID=2722791 RepID=A0ABX1CVH4_9SPHN|nr:Lrp/AsnC family transcriptional regulator [Sphingomonas corticis]NJR80290.1 Lrp/AsnC family transcriptional regulator [Sphingomonas corticis]